MVESVTILPPASAFDPLDNPALYQGVTVKRVLAYAIDIIIVSILGAIVWFGTGFLGLLSLGLLLPLQPLAVALVPLCYHIGLIAGPASATLGMRLFGIRVANIQDGLAPSGLQATIQIIVFYGSIAMTASLVLVIALFNTRRRTLHDFLAGTVVINAENRL